MTAPIGRRQFIASLGVALGAAPVSAGAQPAKRQVRIGWLSGGTSATFAGRFAAFRAGLREQGLTDERIAIEERWADGREANLPNLAGELVRMRPPLIVAVGTPATLAVKQSTDSIAIVMVAVGDPVGSGLVQSLARPGGNVTGLSNLAGDLSGKLLGLLREAVPGLTRAGVLQVPSNPVHGVYWTETQSAAERLGLKLVSVEARRPEDYDAVFAALTRHQAGALVVLPDPLNLIHRVKIVELATRHRLPTMFAMRDYAEVGGLMSYGPNAADLYRRAATYVDKILKGARPADLPVEQPTKFDLVINARTAATLGLTIPQSLLIRADEVLQ